MSVTFSLEHGFEAVTRADREAINALPCPECGGQNRYGVSDPVEADIDCGSCYGYGGDTEAENRLHGREGNEDGEFNVANGNAQYIVQDLLNLSCEEVYGGSVAPYEVLTRLSFTNAGGGVIPPSESQAVRIDENGVDLGCRVINFGRSERQIDSYISRLRRLAEIAVERGAPSIVWG